MIKPFWKSKMVLFNVIAAIVIYFINLAEVGAAPELIAGVVALVNVILRAITTEPIGIKGG